MSEIPLVLYTNHSINKEVTTAFASGINAETCHVSRHINFNQTIASYGYLRGVGEAYKKSKNFWYIDHGYFKSSKRTVSHNRVFLNSLDGYFRIVFNNFWHIGIGNCPDDRFKKLNISFKKKNIKGEHIILSEPTVDAINYYKLENWTKKTISLIKNYSDRKIIIHNKFSKMPLENLLKNAWAFVSDHSNAGLLAMTSGVPAFYTNKYLNKLGNIKNIENGFINYEIFNNLAYGQWTLNEMRNGEAWNFLKQNIL